MAEREYALGRSDGETQRLIQQARLLDLPLRRLFEDAGIEPGMRVLDLGSGAGDVALTAAEFVGETGGVVGVDVNPTILEIARERTHASGCTHVTFQVGDLNGPLDLEGEFDAVVGRYALMYVADPAFTLRSVLDHVRAGGIIAIQELNWATPPFQAFPPSALLQQAVDWLVEGFRRAGTNMTMGVRLYQTFLDAGLPVPQMRAHARVFDESNASSFQHLAAGLRSLRPLLCQQGVVAEDELDPDAIIEELRAEFIAGRKVAIGPLNVDAWARKP